MTVARIPTFLLLLGIFLVPIGGGYVPTDLQAAAPDFRFLSALFGSPDAPVIGHAVSASLILLAWIWAALTNRVVQVPFPKISIALFFVGAIGVGTVALSQFKALSLLHACEWAAMAAAPFAVLAVLGRNSGPRLAVAALAAGCAVMAGLGLLEYASSSDPNWRVFCNWVNPNAAAGMLGIGLPLALGLAAGERGAGRIAAVAGGTLMASALVLTQSKGGILAAVGGIGVFVAFAFWMHRERGSRWAAIAIALAVLVAGFAIGKLATGAAASRTQSADVSALSRLANAESTSEQSFGFRILCWRTAAKLAIANPAGSGPGTFRYESTRPGLIPQTHHAHQGYLQIAAEQGIIGLAALLVAVFLVVREALRGSRSIRGSSKWPLAAVLGSLAASLAHNLVDSDWQHYGTGMAFFLLLGIALVVATDGATPEYFPSGAKAAVALWGSAIVVGMIFFASIDLAKSQARGALQAGDRPAALEHVERLQRMAPSDGEAWYLAALVAGSPDEAFANLTRAATLAPSMRNHRQRARMAAVLGNTGAAVTSLEQALQRDPNNLPALVQLMELYKHLEDFENAEKTARRLLAVESSTAYTVRAIPDSIPTETLRARLFLAGRTLDRAKRADLLQGALRGYVDFARRTVPQILMGAKEDPRYRFAGDGIEEARRALEEGRAALAALRQLQGTGGDSAESEEADAVFSAADRDLASLAK